MPTLVILAAGMGSRYGGLKQLDALGPGGHTILDYSVYDALNAGFDELVFVIRKSMEEDFSALVKRYGRAQVKLVYQELDLLPPGFSVPEGREKPWGTGHAVWACREAVNQPFCVINADDFYGREAFRVMAEFLRQEDPQKARYSMVGFSLEKTLSDHGAVSRGVCEVGPEGDLVSVTERTRIMRRGNAIVCRDEEGGELPGSVPVSMNFWGFTPTVFAGLEARFVEFLRGAPGPKDEFFLPTAVDDMISRGQATVKVLRSREKWVGVTYREDRETAAARLSELTRRGAYPKRLWDGL